MKNSDLNTPSSEETVEQAVGALLIWSQLAAVDERLRDAIHVVVAELRKSMEVMKRIDWLKRHVVSLGGSSDRVEYNFAVKYKSSPLWGDAFIADIDKALAKENP